nr:DUF2924 domain-containing protein [Sphingomonas sp. Root720]
MPLGLGRDLASRAIAWKMQERLSGGLAPAINRELKRLAKQLLETGDIDLGRGPILKPSTKLVRQWHGTIYHILVLDDGFQFQTAITARSRPSPARSPGPHGPVRAFSA